MTKFPTALGVALVVFGCAHRTSKPLESIEGNAIDISVRSHRAPLPIFYHDSAYYLLGEMGRPYEICIINRSNDRIEAVVAVDGRDTISGRTADYRNDRGYVIDPEEETCIDGFRSSMDAVAAFEFTHRKDAYASRMGSGQNVGVIGVAIFEEDAARRKVIATPKRRYRDEAPRPSSGSAMEAEAAAADDAHSLGTGYGAHTESPAESVVFIRKRASDPEELIALYYDGREGLEKRGIRVPDEISFRPDAPDPFPGADGNRFAPPPPER